MMAVLVYDLSIPVQLSLRSISSLESWVTFCVAAVISVFSCLVCKMYPFLVLSLCVTLCCGQYDNEDWTDPTDMFNYDAATGKMNKLKHDTEKKLEAVCEKEGDDTCIDNNNALVKYTEESKQVSEEHKHKEDIKLPESNSNPVFRRYLRKILNEAERFGLPEDSSSEVYYNAEMVLSKQMVIEIQKFIDDEDWNLGSLEDALMRTLVKFRFHNVKEWWTGIFEDYLGIDFGTTFKILLCVTCVVSIIATELWSRIGWFTQIKRLCVLSFIVSVAWNWMYLYKVAFAERQAELAKLHKFDGNCGEKISWSESLIEWFKGASTFQNDPCEEYFKSLMINPVLMVPPTKALALTFTDFITEPLKHVGKAMGEFLNGLLAEIPVFYQLLVLLLIALIFMVTCYGASTTIGQVLMHRNNRETQRERLPPAESQRPRYGNFIEGSYQQPHYLEPGYVQDNYRYPRNQRPESLQAMDISSDRNNLRMPDFTDVDFPLKARNGGQTRRKEEFTEQTSIRELPREKTAEPLEQSSFEKHQRKEERLYGSRQRENDPFKKSSFGQLPRKEDRLEERCLTNYEKTHDSIQEISNSTQQSKTEPVNGQEQMEVEWVDQKCYGEHQTKEEPLHGISCSQEQRREDPVEEISCTEQSWKEEHDKSFKLKGAVKRDPSEQKTDGEGLGTCPLCQKYQYLV
ncbi:chloride channel CLIC-like protein 1 isoform X2 [Rhinoderma darwinii]|uniref:chloride channel CLIC-like protein 1 isoform X2 n=1 Tax=Rhinoderma darwinii TaxID=43563 RepID=UPI003F6786A3